jgi:hypothetical protein
MALFLLEDRDFKSFWIKIWNVGVSVITRSTFSSLILIFFLNCMSCDKGNEVQQILLKLVFIIKDNNSHERIASLLENGGFRLKKYQ